MKSLKNIKKNLYIVLLAGGSGTRFWPLSRHEEPKQFLKIIDGRSLLQETLARVQSLVAAQNVLVVTNRLYQRKVKEQLSFFKISPRNILLEPEGKNTAPAVCWAATKIHRINPEAIMVILPSDHLIARRNFFLKILQEAILLAQKEYLVTLGIVPTRPETGYGYLKTKEIQIQGRTIFKVEKFIEKPSLKIAQKFFRENSRHPERSEESPDEILRFAQDDRPLTKTPQTAKYLWNSGMFIWKAEVILKSFAQFLPKVLHGLNEWHKLPSISIDYGILEKSRNVVTVPASNIGWSDLGSWETLSDHLSRDVHGNTFKGDVLSADCKNTLVLGGKRLIAAVGLNNLAIIDTPDALLISSLNQSQKIKNIVGLLKKQNRPQWLRNSS